MNSTVRKITISALMIALTVICLKVISIYPGFPFVRISFGPALIVFSSLYLGPVYGAVVGAGSDLLGAFVFPTGAYQPLFTLVYGLLGFLPWFLNWIFKRIKNQKFAGFAVYFAIICWFLASMALVWLYPKIDSLTYKIVYSSVGAGLLVAMLVGLHFISKKFAKKYPEYDNKFYRYVLICIVVEIVLMVFANSYVKSLTFEQPYFLVVEWMILISFIDIPLNSFVSYYLELLVSKIR